MYNVDLDLYFEKIFPSHICKLKFFLDEDCLDYLNI